VAVDINDHAYKKRLQGTVLPASTEEKVELLTERLDEQDKRIKELEKKVGLIEEKPRLGIGVISERDSLSNTSPVVLQRSQEGAELGSVLQEGENQAKNTGADVDGDVGLVHTS